MKRAFLILLVFCLSCRGGARSSRSYDEIRDLVTGRTAGEVERLLGAPDLRQSVLDDQRWVWWSYTFLAGEQYAPEVRGQAVHLVITFQNPAAPGAPPRPLAEWRASGPLAVSYSLPARDR